MRCSQFHQSRAAVGTLTLLCLSATLGAAGPQEVATPAPRKFDLAEARRIVELMNDIYVSGVLTTHAMYVREPGNAAAISWGKQVIRQVRAKGWPDTHVFDTTGRPLNPENSPNDAFEREAVDAFKAGKSRLEKVSPGVLRFATSLRLVDKSCLGCHVRGQVGDLVGGLSYTVPLVSGKR